MASADGPALIDVHHHILPPPFVAAHGNEIVSFAGSASVLDWTPGRALEDLDRFGIAKAYTSLGVPGTPDAAVARACNEYAADMTREHPRRFGLLATLPLPNLEASLEEISYAYDELEADGIGLLTTYGGRRIGDPHFVPVFEELSRRRAVIHLHPTAPEACRGLVQEIGDPFLEFPFDTTRAVASLIYGGTLSRCPDLTVVLSHGGGALAMLAGRLGAPARSAGGIPDVPARLSALYADIVTVTDPAPFAAVSAIFGQDQLLFGTDYPYGPPALMVGAVTALEMAEQARSAIAAGTASALFSRPRSETA
ncbi:MAG TPA: amidohydrolase family protein [Solirubrobacteraceae bacterium]|nr:amidohydrolase family protein [Solirubrobacteraceae bacterium]